MHSEEQGIHCENPRLDLPLVNDRKNKIVVQARQGRRGPDEEEQGRVDQGLRHAQGRRQGRSQAADGGTQTLEAKNIIIATGSEARMLPGLSPTPSSSSPTSRF